MCQFCQEPGEVLSYSCGWCGATRTFLLTQTEEEAEVVCLWRDLPQDRRAQMLLILRYVAECDQELREENPAATVHPEMSAVGWPGSHQDFITSP